MFFENTTLLKEAAEKGMLPELETFPAPKTPAQSGGGVIRIVFPEFTCVCPRTGYPDFATIVVCYLPDKLCVELKSWKLYLNSFRMLGTFHESLTAHLFETVKKILQPKWVLVVGDFLPRGNVDTTVVLESDTPRPRGAEFLLGGLRPRCVEIGKKEQSK